MSEGILEIRQFIHGIKKMNISTHASSSAFYVFLSLVPMLVVICTIVPFTPITREDLLGFVLEIFPAKVENIVADIIDDVYMRSTGVLSVAILITLWSAGKGIMAVIRGLNAINEVEEHRNYFVMRLISSFYTLVLLLMILLTMTILVFGNIMIEILMMYFPGLAALFSIFLHLRFLFVWLVLSVVFSAFYAYLPDRKQTFFSQWAGASLGAAIWSVFSWGFSLYVGYGKPYNIYGGLSMIVISMMWIYIGIYIIFTGAYINKCVEKAMPDKEAKVFK